MNESELPAGLIRTTGIGTVQEAADRLVAAIEANPKLRLVAVVDHAKSAARVDLVLEPTIEVIFGNPNLGTPLMQQARTVAIDLPQRMMITQVDGVLEVFHNDPMALAERHGIPIDTPQLAVIVGALSGLAAVAAGA